MAEIEIKPREKRVIWPWILGLLLLIALFVWFVSRDKNQADTPQPESQLKQTPQPMAWQYTPILSLHPLLSQQQA